jgi:hypothetical protein
MLFSVLLLWAAYPHTWMYMKLVTLFKKGTRTACDNYRGISLMDSLAKTYDIVLNRRLGLWFTPDREQAGSQKGRGCVEHLLTLRLLIDYSMHTRQKLYLIFVDFSKAYDRVPRDLLVHKLAQMGCGALMLHAIAAIYKCTKMILRTAIVSAVIGVRQGSPTSCFLFTLMVNDLIRDLKRRCAPDGFLEWLHVLMLMDDTILLATNRQRAIEKVHVLMDFCRTSGMQINEAKTKFMVINGTEEERQQMTQDDLEIKNCDTYTNLGMAFRQDGKLGTSMKTV